MLLTFFSQFYVSSVSKSTREFAKTFSDIVFNPIATECGLGQISFSLHVFTCFTVLRISTKILTDGMTTKDISSILKSERVNSPPKNLL